MASCFSVIMVNLEGMNLREMAQFLFILSPCLGIMVSLYVIKYSLLLTVFLKVIIYSTFTCSSNSGFIW